MTIFSKLDIILSISSLETDNIDNNYSIAPIQKSEYLSRKGLMINSNKTFYPSTYRPFDKILKTQ